MAWAWRSGIKFLYVVVWNLGADGNLSFSRPRNLPFVSCGPAPLLLFENTAACRVIQMSCTAVFVLVRWYRLRKQIFQVSNTQTASICSYISSLNP